MQLYIIRNVIIGEVKIELINFFLAIYDDN